MSAYLFVGSGYVYTRITTAEVTYVEWSSVKEKQFAPLFRERDDSCEKIF